MIKKISNLKYSSFIASSQVKMALETENYELDLGIVSKGVEAVISDPMKGNYYVYLVGEEPVACLLTVPEWSDWRNKTVLWIHSVYVEKNFRSKGYFKEMYQYLKEKVSESSELSGLRLYVDKRNTNALGIYHNLGMESEHYTLCEWLKD